MKKLRKLIALASSIAMMSMFSLSVSAEEIIPAETVLTTTTAVQETTILDTTTTTIPSVNFLAKGYVNQFVDGYEIDFGNNIGDSKYAYVYLKNIGDIVSAYGKLSFSVNVDDTSYTLRYNWSFDYVEEPCLMIYLPELIDTEITVNEGETFKAVQMDYELLQKIYGELKNCSTARFDIEYSRDKSSDLPVVTGTTDTMLTTTTTTTTITTIGTTYTGTYTTTTTVPFTSYTGADTTTSLPFTGTYTGTTTTFPVTEATHLVKPDGGVWVGYEITVPICGANSEVTVTPAPGSEDIAEITEIEYFEYMINIHLIGLSEGYAEFIVTFDDGTQIPFGVAVIERESTETNLTTTATGVTASNLTTITTAMTSTFATSTTGGETGTTHNIKGDVNLDDKVNIADAVAIASYVGNPEKNPIDEQGKINGDVHNKGNGLSADDALMIQLYASSQVESLD